MILLAEISSGLEWFLAALMLAFGGCVGSFLNVVIFRLPAGKSIVHPPSHCPKCKHPIRAGDNIPVVGWVLLRGRCRDCSTPISIRYPTVEALMGVVFLVLYVSEIHFGDITLPIRSSFLSPFFLRWITYAYHLLLLSTLVSAVLIQFDRQQVPWTLYAPAWVVGAFAPLWWVTLRPLPLVAGVTSNSLAAGMFEGLAGFAVGALLGILYAIRYAKDRPVNNHRGTDILLMASVGLFLGWQAVVTIAAASAVFFLIATLVSRVKEDVARIPHSAYMTTVTVCYIMVWSGLIERWTWLGDKAGWLTLGGAIALVLLASMIRSFVAKPAVVKKRKR